MASDSLFGHVVQTQVPTGSVRHTTRWIGAMDALEERLLRELAARGQLTAEELASNVHARQWVDLSTALAQLAARGYVTAVGPLGRANTRYRAHAQGLAALDRPD